MTRISSKPFSRTTRFTRLFARILEEDGAYVVQVRLDNHTLGRAEDTAWGEELADSIESASEMIADLATRFSISEDSVTLELRLDNIAENTRH
jgi:hypothetical protein